MAERAGKDDLLVQDILEHAEEALLYLEGVTMDQFRRDRRLQLQVERLLEIVGEAAGAWSPELREEVEFDWQAVRGLRNVIAHQYGFIDHARLYLTVKNRLPVLAQRLRDR